MAGVLTTGGGGFIGSSVARALVALGHKVHVLDKYDVRIPGAKCFRGSILDQAAILEAMEGCEYVVHMAAFLGVRASTRNALECLDVNIIGTRNVLECCVKRKVRRIFFSSSSEVYGEPRDVPIKEGATLSPISEYGVSKVVGEEYCRAYYQHFGLPFTIARFFNAYGDKQRDDFVMSVFTTNAVLGLPLRVNGDGLQTRAFCYVDDIVDGVIRLLFSPKTRNTVFNIGNPLELITIADLAGKIIKHAGVSPSLIRHAPLGSQDRAKSREIHNRLPDISKVRRMVGFMPKISLDEGIRRVIAYKKAAVAAAPGRRSRAVLKLLSAPSRSIVLRDRTETLVRCAPALLRPV